MEFIKKNQHLIFAVVGILIAICGIVMTVTAILERKKTNAILVTETYPQWKRNTPDITTK